MSGDISVPDAGCSAAPPAPVAGVSAVAVSPGTGAAVAQPASSPAPVMSRSIRGSRNLPHARARASPTCGFLARKPADTDVAGPCRARVSGGRQPMAGLAALARNAVDTAGFVSAVKGLCDVRAMATCCSRIGLPARSFIAGTMGFSLYFMQDFRQSVQNGCFPVVACDSPDARCGPTCR